MRQTSTRLLAAISFAFTITGTEAALSRDGGNARPGGAVHRSPHAGGEVTTRPGRLSAAAAPDRRLGSIGFGPGYGPGYGTEAFRRDGRCGPGGCLAGGRGRYGDRIGGRRWPLDGVRYGAGGYAFGGWGVGDIGYSYGSYGGGAPYDTGLTPLGYSYGPGIRDTPVLPPAIYVIGGRSRGERQNSAASAEPRESSSVSVRRR